MKRILAIASKGGHFVQLDRITRSLSQEYGGAYHLTYVSTSTEVPAPAGKLYTITDFSRWNLYRLPIVFFHILHLILRIRPQVIISTGAAPGLVAIIAGKCCGKRSIWIDSMANVDKPSMSGKIASYIATKSYVQYPHLTSKRMQYIGNAFLDLKQQ